LQERTYERVGSSKSLTTNVRVIAATHRNLETHIEEGRFREDLFYRLNVFPIEMPSLRERPEDIPLLINELITRIEHENRGTVRLTSTAIASLCRYPWSGNVRELANVIERLVILYPYGTVDFDDLPEKFQLQGEDLPEAVTTVIEQGPELRPVEKVDVTDNASTESSAHVVETKPLGDEPELGSLPEEGLDLKEHLANLEYLLIKQALDEASGIVAHAANKLKMRRTTLVEKMRKYGIQREAE
jgi:sigma-54 dependent transcriptional regulator, flagellar regulatory protein